MAACARRCRWHRLEVRSARARQAHLESGRLCHRRAAPGFAGRVGFAGAVGVRRLVRCAVVLLRHPGAACGAAFGRGTFLSRQPRAAPVRARLLAWRPLGYSAASIAERLVADLLVLHDLRPAHHAGLPHRAADFRTRSRAPGTLPGVFHADASGALHRADRALAADPSHRQRFSSGALHLARSGMQGVSQ